MTMMSDDEKGRVIQKEMFKALDSDGDPDQNEEIDLEEMFEGLDDDCEARDTKEEERAQNVKRVQKEFEAAQNFLKKEDLTLLVFDLEFDFMSQPVDADVSRYDCWDLIEIGAVEAPYSYRHESVFDELIKPVIVDKVSQEFTDITNKEIETDGKDLKPFRV